MKICVLGAGTWGLALAELLYENRHEVSVWSALGEEIDRLKQDGTHRNFPNKIFPSGIDYTDDISIALSGKEAILFVVPSAYIRSTAASAAPYIPEESIVINASKGIEPGTLMTMTEVISSEIEKTRPALRYSIAALSGPTHAEEVVRGLPTSIVSACEDENVSRRIAEVFASSCLRVYTNTDVRGVEIAGALKNIIALAAGINRGMGFGDNSGAMLMTRGIAEMTRLGIAMGCNARTFSGLAGIGDLVVTCTSVHSRNNRCGELIGKGLSYADASKQVGMVVEGYHALEAAMQLSEKYGVEMPISTAVNDVIKNGVSCKEAMLRLMNRDIKSELII